VVRVPPISPLGTASKARDSSSYPSAGGLYMSAYLLAPEKWAPLAAWVTGKFGPATTSSLTVLTGWCNLIGQVLTAPSIDWALASLITSVAVLFHPNYAAQNWHSASSRGRGPALRVSPAYLIYVAHHRQPVPPDLRLHACPHLHKRSRCFTEYDPDLHLSDRHARCLEAPAQVSQQLICVDKFCQRNPMARWLCLLADVSCCHLHAGWL
jgi:hypothetical protein